MPSSVIARYRYDAASETLTVVFLSGLVYEYYGVPEPVYEDMKASGSKGTYLNKHIKGVFDFQKIDRDE